MIAIPPAVRTTLEQRLHNLRSSAENSAGNLSLAVAEAAEWSGYLEEAQREIRTIEGYLAEPAETDQDDAGRYVAGGEQLG